MLENIFPDIASALRRAAEESEEEGEETEENAASNADDRSSITDVPASQEFQTLKQPRFVVPEPSEPEYEDNDADKFYECPRKLGCFDSNNYLTTPIPAPPEQNSTGTLCGGEYPRHQPPLRLS